MNSECRGWVGNWWKQILSYNADPIRIALAGIRKIEYKLVFVVHKSLHNEAPMYLSELCGPKVTMGKNYGQLLAISFRFLRRTQIWKNVRLGPYCEAGLRNAELSLTSF